MSTARMHRILIAWLAMLAIMFGALAPTLVHAMASAGDRGVGMEICTSTGMLLLNVDAPDSDAGDAGDPQRQCVWCGLHVHADVAVQAVAPVPLLGCAQDMPPAFYRSGFVSAVWRTALSRGPPLT